MRYCRNHQQVMLRPAVPRPAWEVCLIRRDGTLTHRSLHDDRLLADLAAYEANTSAKALGVPCRYTSRMQVPSRGNEVFELSSWVTFAIEYDRARPGPYAFGVVRFGRRCHELPNCDWRL